MTQYIKDGVIYTNIEKVVINGRQYINPSEKRILEAGYEIYTPEPTPTPERTLEDAINEKVAQIEEYDTSSNVNVFYYQGNEFWLDKTTRMGLMNSTEIEKKAGRATSKLILGDYSFEFPCDTIIAMLEQLELYAKDCYDVTAQHKLNVKALTTVEEVDAYDFTTGYPEKLNFGSNPESATAMTIQGASEVETGKTYQYAVSTTPSNATTDVSWNVE